MTYKYKLDTSSKKFYCPNCNKKEFVRLVDAEGNYLSEIYGRCDRQVKCKYDKRPSDTSILKPIPQTTKIEPYSFFSEELQERTMTMYKANSLYQILSKIYDDKTIISVFSKYFVGTSKKWGGSPIYWQKDEKGCFRTGKIIAYDIDTTKRIKKPFSKISWAHKEAKLSSYNLKQVLFGCHLIADSQSDIFCLVEAEKTAIVGACELPQFIWLSTGGEQNFKKDMLKPLRDKKVVVFPDTDKHSKWQELAIKYGKELNIDMVVSEYVMDQTINLDRSVFSDLADLVLLKHVNFNKSEFQLALEFMIKKNPSLKILIQEFDLDTEKGGITRII